MEPMTRVRPLDCGFELDAPARNRDWYEVRGYEAQSTALFRTVVADADVVLDIGAHVGYYSLLARTTAPEAHVVAVEASPENAAVLRGNVERLDGEPVRVVAAAFAARPGTAAIQLTEASDNSGISGHPNSPTRGTVEVPAVTGADLDLPPGGKLVVKLDVEGHELAALDGLETTLAAYDDVRLLVEMNPKCLRLAGSAEEALIDRLRGLGLRIFVLDEEGRSALELRADTSWSDLVDPAGYANLYCVRAERCTTVGAALHSSSHGGGERSHAEMVELLVRDGSMVHSVLPEPDQGLGHELRSVGGTVHLVPPAAWWTLWPEEDDGSGTSWADRQMFDGPLTRELERVRPDVVLTQTGVVPQAAVAAAALRIPHVWFLREFLDLDHGLVVPGGRELFARTVRTLSDRVLANSRAVAEHLLGDAADAAVIAPPSPRVVDLHPVPRPADRERFTLGVIGSLTPGKGQEDAIRAVARLRDEGRDVGLVLFGASQPHDVARVTRLVDELGLADLVEMPGMVVDRTEVYGRIDCVAVTSRHEAFGRVPFEATAAGIPVVHSLAGGPAEYLEDGVTALGYAVGDDEGLASAVRRLADDPALAADLVAAARQELLGPGRCEALVQTVTTALREAVAAPTPPARAMFAALGRAAMVADRWRAETDDLQADLARVVRQHEELVDRFTALEAEHAELVTGHLGYVEAHEQYVAHSEANGGPPADVVLDLTTSSRNNARLRAQVSDLYDEIAAAQERQRAAESTLAETRHALALVTGSRTWRWRARAARILGRR